MISRTRMLELAQMAFVDYCTDCTDGELHDMLIGNAIAYSGMPDLSQWLEQFQLNEVCEYDRRQP